MNFLRSSPFFSVADALHSFILFCWVVAAKAANAWLVVKTGHVSIR